MDFEFFITRNEEAVGCPFLYTDTIHYAILFIEITKTYETIKPIGQYALYPNCCNVALCLKRCCAERGSYCECICFRFIEM